MQPSDLIITHNEREHRFEGRFPHDPGMAVTEYYQTGDSVIITHTEVPQQWGGRGIAAKIVRYSLDEMKTWGKTVVPACSYVAAYIAKNPEYQPLTHPKS